MTTLNHFLLACLTATMLWAGDLHAGVGDRLAGGRGQPSAGGRLPHQLTEAEQDELRAFITEYFPETAQEMQGLIETRPRLAQRRLQRILPDLVGLMRARREEPEALFRLKVAALRTRFDIQRVEQAYRQADDDQRDALAEELRTRIERALDIRQQIGRLQIKRLQNGINELQKRVDFHAAHQAEIIQHEMARRLNLDPGDRPPGGLEPLPGDSGHGDHRSVTGIFDRPPGMSDAQRPWPPHKNFIDQLPEEERRRVRAFIKDYFPDAARELRRQLDRNPQAGQRSLRQLWAEMRRLMVSRESDPAPLFDLKIRQVRIEMAMRRLQRIYGNAPERKRTRLRDELQDYLERSVGLRHEIGQMEIERLQRGISRLDDRLERDTRERDRIIEQELSRRLSGGQGRQRGKRARLPDPPGGQG